MRGGTKREVYRPAAALACNAPDRCGRATAALPGVPTKSPAEAGLSSPRPPVGGPSMGQACSADTTLTVRRFCGPLVANSTLPSTSANSVWSRPRPTPAPG